MQNLKQKTINGIIWGFSSQLGIEFFKFVVSIILARLLTPNDYGLIAMVVFFSGFSNVFINFSFGPAIIQKKELTENDLSSIFWANLLLGIFFSSLLAILSPFIASFFNEPILLYLALFLSINFVIGSVNVIQRSLFERDLNFKVIAKARVIAAVVSGTLAVILAYYKYGVWSLAIYATALIMLEGILLWLYSSWRPKWTFHIDSIKSVSKFSAALLGERSLGYLVENTDKLLLGKMLGSGELGLYNKAYGFFVISYSKHHQSNFYCSFSFHFHCTK